MGLRGVLIATAVIFVAVQAGADTAGEVERSVRAIQATHGQGLLYTSGELPRLMPSGLPQRGPNPTLRTPTAK